MWRNGAVPGEGCGAKGGVWVLFRFLISEEAFMQKGGSVRVSYLNDAGGGRREVWSAWRGVGYPVCAKIALV